MNQSQEKTYLKWYNKLGYGIGDFASNYVMAFVSFFLMWYLTDTVGLNGAIIGTLILIAKLADGVTDMIFGNLIDRTHSKWGKAKPWMFWSTFPLCIGLVLEFAIPNMGATAQYAYFMVVYVLLNSVFYTANSISYSTLSALITRNQGERVQLGSIRYIFAFSAMMLLSITTNILLTAFGGGAYGWRMTAICYAVFACIVNTISCLSVKELPEEHTEAVEEGKAEPAEKVSLIEALKTLGKNKYFFIVLGIYICFFFSTAIISGAGAYYTQRVLEDPSKFGTMQIAINLPLIVGLFVVPTFVNKLGIYKANVTGMTLSVIAGALAAYAAYARNFPLLLVFLALRGLFNAPLMGTLNTWIAEVAEYSFLKTGNHIEGSVFSCTSIGNKLGSGLGSAAIGWLLAAAGYNGLLDVQPASAISMITFVYAVLPAIMFVVIGILCYIMKIEKPLSDLREAQNK